MFIEANTVERPAHLKQDEYKKKHENLLEEVKRLENEEKMPKRNWSEFEILSLTQMLVEFLDGYELKTRARKILGDLEDFALDRAVSYDVEVYKSWNKRIENAITRLEVSVGKKKREREARDELEALVQEVHAHLAEYERLWAEGSVYLEAIILCGVLSVVTLAFMGLLPIVDPGGNGVLGILNWGLLGIVGAVTGALVGLHESNATEVGNTRAKQELQRIVLGVGIGFVSGVLAYSAIYAGIVQGSIFPDLAARNTGGAVSSVFWAVVSGYGFREVFGRVEKVVVRNL